MSNKPLPARRTLYVETFDTGPGGWFAWRPARHMPSPLEECSIPPEIESGALISRSPWWVDAAAPGLRAPLGSAAVWHNRDRYDPHRLSSVGDGVTYPAVTYDALF